MVKAIVTDPSKLSEKSTPVNFATERDALENLIQDLQDTANANKPFCAGLAAIQIGVPKDVILVQKNGKFIEYINPEILWASPAARFVKEGCLSVDGYKFTKRHYRVKVRWFDREGKEHTGTFDGWPAQVIQHEIDHCNGITI